jgi:hypothetical protein
MIIRSAHSLLAPLLLPLLLHPPLSSSSLHLPRFPPLTSVLASYYIPEDGDTIDHPNFFSCDQNSLTLGQLKKVWNIFAAILLTHSPQIFPVPGQYHFRFKRAIGSATVWMDATNDTSLVPVDSSGKVFSKVSRIRSSVASQTQTSQQKAPVPVPQPQEPLLSTSPRNEPTSVPAVEQKTRERRNSDKLLSFDNFDEPVQPAQPGLVPPPPLVGPDTCLASRCSILQ